MFPLHPKRSLLRKHLAFASLHSVSVSCAEASLTSLIVKSHRESGVTRSWQAVRARLLFWPLRRRTLFKHIWMRWYNEKREVNASLRRGHKRCSIHLILILMSSGPFAYGDAPTLMGASGTCSGLWSLCFCLPCWCMVDESKRSSLLLRESREEPSGGLSPRRKSLLELPVSSPCYWSGSATQDSLTRPIAFRSGLAHG